MYVIPIRWVNGSKQLRMRVSERSFPCPLNSRSVFISPRFPILAPSLLTPRYFPLRTQTIFSYSSLCYFLSVYVSREFKRLNFKLVKLFSVRYCGKMVKCFRTENGCARGKRARSSHWPKSNNTLNMVTFIWNYILRMPISIQCLYFNEAQEERRRWRNYICV